MPLIINQGVAHAGEGMGVIGGRDFGSLEPEEVHLGIAENSRDKKAIGKASSRV